MNLNKIESKDENEKSCLSFEKSKEGSIMISTGTSIITHNHTNVRDFISHVMTRFSQWSGVNVGYLFNMFEISGNEYECLNVIEDCLRKFGKRDDKPNEYPWPHTTSNGNTRSGNLSITVECNSLLNELEKIRTRTKGDLVFNF